ncbi:HEPN domain-containing protein [Sphingobacterium alkalisoli]|uniref:HEPN domain-containing protein n=1 Tax=Sphingobacterium alkalisoli TaxID=1874115 RepID=A0A4U0GUL6_9SPHI|nr:HEPN domain-containing protein [Sphingobacterium alkalisoli]TJY62781.1 HEPN domain-containing protein [Sphingobacterium alkalisoli]GGH28859.1 DNA-binding protein [Sphingobacterium alkalisoli]
MNPLSHLPVHKQEELAEIVKVICEIADPAKIILFGSHTTDKWVEDVYEEKGSTYSYISDYDILVALPDGDKEKEHDVASKIENRTLKYKNDVSPIVHSIDYVNKGLEMGQYFFRDIVKEGIVLFDTGEHIFSEPKPLTNEQEKEIAIRNFDKWIKSGSRFLKITKNSVMVAEKDGDPLNEIIFTLNQSAEKFYGGLLLVYTGYKPKTHKLKVYRKYSKHIDENLNQVFKYPIDDREEYRLFDILNKAYLDARYQDDYYIAPEDLKKLIGKLEILESVILELCQQKINSF